MEFCVDAKILDIIMDPDVNIGILVGGRRKGKSVLGYGIIDDLHNKGLDTYEFGLPFIKESLLPEHVKPTADLDSLPVKSACVIDEAYKEFYSRQSMSLINKFVDTLVALSGQKEIKLFYITQHTRRLEKGIVGEADFYLFKKPSLVQMEFDRTQFKPLLKDIYEEFKKLKPPPGMSLSAYQKKCTYVFSEDFVGMIENSNVPPEWWTEEFSKAYGGIPIKLSDQKPRDVGKVIVKVVSKYLGGKKDRTIGYNKAGQYTPKSKRDEIIE